MPEFDECSQCGATLEPNAPPGLCPQCSLKAGMETQTRTGHASPGTGAKSDRSRFVPPDPAELAQHFPQLEILEILGQGGMGVVYKARQTKLDRFVALKILPPETGTAPAFADRFAREARTLAKLSHPNIVNIHDFGEVDGLFYFVMEYVDGLNLRRLLSTGQLSPQEALRIVPQICNALETAHEHGVVHRDIKPENVLLDKKGNVKIADFGLAKLLQHTPSDLTLTATQQVVGTHHYMAPEQLFNPQEVDHRADIYSLGVVFYEMLTGELPIGRFAPPSERVCVDVRLDQVVLRALEREPDRRYQHATEIKTDVESIAQTAPTPDPTAGATVPTRHSHFTTALLVLLTLAVAVLTLRDLVLPATPTKPDKTPSITRGAPNVVDLETTAIPVEITVGRTKILETSFPFEKCYWPRSRKGPGSYTITVEVLRPYLVVVTGVNQGVTELVVSSEKGEYQAFEITVVPRAPDQPPWQDDFTATVVDPHEWDTPVKVAVGRALFIDFTSPFKKVEAVAVGIIRLEPLSDQRLQVTGVKEGNTQLTVWRDDSVWQSFDVTVVSATQDRDGTAAPESSHEPKRDEPDRP
ncbi:MAG: protein kinase [Phycisphaerae bacterium]